MIWQTEKRQKMLKKSGQIQNFFTLENLFIEKRKLSFGQYGLFITGVDKNIFSKDLLEKLKFFCKKQKALFIQIEFLDYFSNFRDLESLFSIKNLLNLSSFKKGFYKNFIRPETILIDLNKSLDQILSEMKGKGRYNIKVAQKNKVEIIISDKKDKDIEKFFEMIQDTAKRDNFNINSINFYKTFLKEIQNSKLILAKVENEIIAGGIFVLEENVFLYYYGASFNKHRNFMASYLLQWEAIKLAKKMGAKIYDFLGVSREDKKLQGVTNFKQKFFQEITRVSKSYIFINKKFRYFSFVFIKKIFGR